MPPPALAQRTGENAVTSADDAFGTSVGNETIGLYSTDEVRGFSPAAAGNIRIDGLYLGGIVIGNQRIQSGSNVRVGLSAQGYAFPAPTGIVELSIRPGGTEPALSGVLYAGQSQIGIDLDGQLPLSSTLEPRRRHLLQPLHRFPGRRLGDYFDFGIAPAWRPREGTEVRAYYGVQIAPEGRQHALHLRRRNRASAAPAQPPARPEMGRLEEPLLPPWACSATRPSATGG